MKKEVCKKRAPLPIWLYNLPVKEGIGFVCVRTCSPVSSLCRICVFVFVCRGDRVCKEEDVQHASCPLLCLLFGLHYPTVTGLCWYAVYLCVCEGWVCIGTSTCVCITMCLILQLCVYFYSHYCKVFHC